MGSQRSSSRKELTWKTPRPEGGTRVQFSSIVFVFPCPHHRNYFPVLARPAAPPTACPAILDLGLVLALVQYCGPLRVLASHRRPEQQSLSEAQISAGRRHTGCDCCPEDPPLLLLPPPPPPPLTDSRLQHVGPAFARTVGHRLVVRTPSDMA
jgi:hypothetical protein